jgi:hypothetical protein
MSKNTHKTEEFRVNGKEVVAKIKKIIAEGNARKIILKNEAGKTLFTIPLTLGVVGAVLLPVFVAISAVAALATNMTIVVEKRD